MIRTHVDQLKPYLGEVPTLWAEVADEPQDQNQGRAKEGGDEPLHELLNADDMSPAVAAAVEESSDSSSDWT